MNPIHVVIGKGTYGHDKPLTNPMAILGDSDCAGYSSWDKCIEAKREGCKKLTEVQRLLICLDVRLTVMQKRAGGISVFKSILPVSTPSDS